MPKTRPYARIAITLPERDLAAADRLALAQDRSRSWIVAEAIRRFVLQSEAERPSTHAEDAVAVADHDAADASPVGVGPTRESSGMEASPGHAPGIEYDTHRARVCSRLNAEGARYVLVGATAMQLWGTTRATQEIDILIEPTVTNAKRVLRALASLGFDTASEHLAQDVASRPVTVIGGIPNVDILTRAWDVQWGQAQPRAITFEVEGVTIPTASIDDLIASKRTGRLQDAADIEVLEEIQRRRATPA